MDRRRGNLPSAENGVPPGGKTIFIILAPLANVYNNRMAMEIKEPA